MNKEFKDSLVINESKNSISILTPKDFSFKECLVFLARSKNEVLHQVRGEYFYKVIKIENELILLKISGDPNQVLIEFTDQIQSDEAKVAAAAFVWDLFDLDRDLTDFYQLSKNDQLLQQLINQHFGLRVIGIPDLFEAFTWAIMGQQINLTFAFSLKRSLVEKYGERLKWKDETFWLFPTPNVIAELKVSDLTSLKFTTRKAEYIIGIAKLMAEGSISKEKLDRLDSYEEKLNKLVEIRGVGNWTADYVLMKCLKEKTAFPIADVGIHNAIKNQLALDKKPSIDEIKKLATKWKGWEAYVTFYLWRSLYS
ncbi:DNA-3-methyladenine glycosylase [Bacillus sp. AFS041924]|uniref:DNA-3-methyladenine glycosylase family protein n=1 Tax=Bacillus sp. AFS041924 TaxID=2033503 RepID=UPI000BFB906E|nr:DNA-3-methyladenine glycosylase [Bacillus sp. AFS041924]PGS47317.1 DNA-3-methyladenine glycosylase [Bacillus sp. AFS041924]